MRTHIGQLLMERIQNQLDKQNGKGFDKYKETLDDCKFEEYDWNIMIIEELIDGLQYAIKENEYLKEQLRELQESKDMKLKEYQEMSKRTLPKNDGFTIVDNMNKSNYALGLNGEAGELGEIVKKNVHHNHPFDRDDFVNEAGDVLHYLAGLCSMYGVTLDEVATHNIMKLAKRYPKGFNSQDSISRGDVGYTSSFQDDMNNMYKVDVKA